jgi:adenosine deaminase
MSVVDRESIRALPKAVLHDHLDGGLRVGTILEIADETGYQGLPANDSVALSDWFHQGMSGSLERYLEAFVHTVAVMQTEDAISRVAFEAVEDLALDGVVYAEIRFAPSLNTAGGLPVQAVLEAAHDGFTRARSQYEIAVGMIVTAMRQETDSEEIARAALAAQSVGAVAFDLAGPEAGYPPTRHIAACRAIRKGGLGLTIHAGEGAGPHSMWQAVAECAAQRVGHGVRVAEDTDFDGVSMSRLGAFARRIRDHRVPLEVAITSNVHTGTYASATEHPFGELYRNGFDVSINTDNRLMSGVTMTDELELASTTFDLGLEDLGQITTNAIQAGFLDYQTRRRIIDEIVAPAYGLG